MLACPRTDPARLPSWRLPALALLLASGSPDRLAAQETLSLEPCALPGLPVEARCGVHQVRENRAGGNGRRITLHFVLVPARGTDAAPDPILVLQGGPGSSNVASAARMARSPLRDRRALLLIDLRGTGRSHPLDCDFTQADGSGVRTDFFPPDRVRVCRESLAQSADLARYATPHVVDDLREVLDVLGISRVNLWGFSGGTRQALAFLRQHPERVRSALLEGPVPIDARIPMTFATDTEEALDGVLGECLAEPACGQQFPNLRQELPIVLARLTDAPPVIQVRDPATQTATPVSVTRSAFAQVIRYMLYQPGATQRIPLAVHLAARGDFTLMADRLRTLGVPGGISIGFYLSSTCAEDLPWFDEEAAARRAAGTMLGDYRIRQQKAACADWPREELPPGYLEPVRSDIPVLVLVGERDPVTPPRWGREVVAHLGRARLIVVPGGGHSFAGLDGGTCLDEIRVGFLRDAAPDSLDVTCLGQVGRPAFVLTPPDR